VLRPGGLFFFHTFNRSWLSWVVVIKGVEWFVKNTPKDMHVLHSFVKPSELRVMCEASKMTVMETMGSRPALGANLLRLAATGVVPRDFAFVFTRSEAMGYTGVARRAV
jgi:2-polyprenyl-6-hydroxyphenyl methylase/3-demethylubiquinone-9 3-methyltransferase